MNLFARARIQSCLSLTLAALLAAPAASQTGKPGAPGGTGGNGTGGSYRGPGDTVPNGRTGTTVAPAPGVPHPDYPSATPPLVPGVARPRIPPPGMPGSPWDTPEETPNGRPFIDDETSWQHWWHYNRWEYLDIEQRLAEIVLTGSGGYFLGRGEQQDDDLYPLRPSLEELQQVVLPALVHILKEETSPELVSQAVLALAKVRIQPAAGTEGFSQLAARHLRHANQTVVERAILALGVNGNARFLRWLEAILADEPDGQARLGGGSVPDRARAFAAYGLGLLAERSRDPVVRARVYAALSRALHGSAVEVQGAAMVAMGHVLLPWEPLDTDSTPSPLEARSRGDSIAEVLAFLEDEEGSPDVRAQAPGTLARMLTDAPEETRALVAEALLLVVDEQSKATRELQNGAVLALGEIGNSGELAIDVDVRDELERIASQSAHHRLTRHMASIALAQVSARPGAEPTPYAGLAPTRRMLMRQLEHGRGQTLCWNALAVGILERDAAARGEMPSPEVCGALRRMLERNRTPEVVGAAAIALGLIRDVESLPALHERMLETGEAHVRGYTALALGMIGARSAAAGVHRVLEEAEQQPFALQQAAIGLALLGDDTTSALLFSLLGRASDPVAQASIAGALGWLRDPRPIRPLAERLSDAALGGSGRTWTAVALGRICDFDPWPWVARWSVGANYDAQLSSLIDDDFQSGLLDLP